ncbi:MAG TPA: hypothetical protein VFR41_04845, partial [Acidimicrobiia bacterium]|nr:hypothetical protein [Acidimicrobiia bacterium]
RRRVRLAVFGMSLLTALCLFVLVAFQVFAAQHAFTMDRLQKERTNEQLRYERLRAEVARLSSPQAIVAAARKLGMEPSDRVEVVNAPKVGPRTSAPDGDGHTLSTSWSDTKRHLEP